METTASDPSPLHVAVLGPLEIRRGGDVLDLGGSKQRTLIAALALEENRTVSDAELLKILWGNEPPEGATDALRVHVHRLRRTIDRSSHGDHPETTLLVRRLTGYSLVLTAEQLDLARFRRLLKEARTLAGQGESAHALRLLDAALAFWRGPILTDVGDSPFVASHRSRLEKMHLEALEDRFDLCLRLGLHFENVNAIESLAEGHPLRERLQGQLLVALYRCGRQAEASDAYQRTRQRLADELGMEPGPDLQATFREILRQEVVPIPPRTQHPKTFPTSEAPRRHSNLPAELSSFIGRDGQIAEVIDLLTTNRQVSLVGPGGIGKTRLAMQVAGRLLKDYSDGVWMVDLATVIDAETLSPQVLTWLGFRDMPDRTPETSLVSILEHRHLLLVVDNCEHLVDATADLVQVLLRRCPHVSILATSRERLNCDGEQVCPVPPLDIPNWELNLPVERVLEHDAVRLFVERTRKTRPSFVLSADNARAVTQLCLRLDGIPLAIELAAARGAALSPAQLLEHLDNKFRLVAGSRRASVSRHRTMRETIDWSHRLLTAEEQRLFRRLSVFAGSFDLAAVEAVCEDDELPLNRVVEVLGKLVDKSLVAYADAVAGEGRYRLLETVRQYAQEMLAGDATGHETRNRHAVHYLHVGERFESGYRDGAFGELARVLEAEYANARAALEWTEGASTDLFLALASTWWHYWWLRGSLAEGRVWLGRARTSSGGSARTRARVLCGSGRLAALQGDLAEAETSFTEGLELALVAGDSVTAAVLHNSLGLMALRRESAAEAVAHFERAVAVWKSINMPTGLVPVYGNLGDCLFLLGEYDQAREMYRSALQISAVDSPAMATVLLSLANLERHIGEYRSASEHAGDGLRVAYRGDYVMGLSSALETVAFVAAAEEEPFRAAVLAEGSAVLNTRCGAIPDYFPYRPEAEQRLSDVCGRLDPEALASARHLAAVMSVDDVVAYALSDADRTP